VAADAVDAGLKSSNPDIRASAERAMHPGLTAFVDPTGRRPAPQDISGLTTAQAAKTILEAHEFVVIGDATAADAPPPAIAIRMISNHSGKYAAAYHFMRVGTLEAKLYGLSLLYFGDATRFHNAANDLADQRGEVSVIDNGVPRKMLFKDVVARIVSGEYPRRMTALYLQNSPTSQPAKYHPY
jgi:hypothetical protein